MCPLGLPCPCFLTVSRRRLRRRPRRKSKAPQKRADSKARSPVYPVSRRARGLKSVLGLSSGGDLNAGRPQSGAQQAEGARRVYRLALAWRGASTRQALGCCSAASWRSGSRRRRSEMEHHEDVAQNDDVPADACWRGERCDQRRTRQAVAGARRPRPAGSESRRSLDEVLSSWDQTAYLHRGTGEFVDTANQRLAVAHAPAVAPAAQSRQP